MNVMASVVKNYFGGDEGKDIISLQMFLKLTANNRVKKGTNSMKVRDTENFLSVVLDSHIEAAILTYGGELKTIEKLEEACLRGLVTKNTKKKNGTGTVPTENPKPPLDIVEVVRQIAADVFDLGKLQDIRHSDDGIEKRYQPPKNMKNRAAEIERIFAEDEATAAKYPGLKERDPVYENSILFMRDAFVLREYAQARKNGDSGRIAKCIEYWCLFFLGSTWNKNYSKDTLHMVVCLKKVWGPRLKDMWLNTCMINLLGIRRKWMTDDELVEYIVRGVKEFMDASSNAYTADFLRDTISRQIIHMLKARKAMHAELGTVRYGSSSAKENVQMHVNMFRDKLIDEEAFSFKPGRVKLSNKDNTFCYEARDMVGEGMKELRDGDVLARYKAGARYQWSKGGFDDGDGDRDKELVVEAEFEDVDGLTGW